MKNDLVHLIPVTVEEVVELAAEKQQVPYGVEMINAPKVWKATDRGKDVVIAVLDTGCDLDHPDLKGQIIGGRNFTDDYGGDPKNYDDNHFHGTHVSGTMAALDNDTGVVGVAPKVKLLVLKVLDKDGAGDYQNIIDAVNYATDWKGDNGEKVCAISLSLGGPNDEPELHDAIKGAVDEDILVVCAAGNEGDGRGGTDEISYPGYYKEVIEVGAVDEDKKLADFSSSNKRVNLVAPGVEVLSTYSDGQYAKLSGTSMATPHVSSAAALLFNELKQKLDRAPTERELFSELNKQTTSLGYTKKEEGNGLVHLTADQESDPGDQPDPGKDKDEKSYQIAVKPLADGYTIELGFENEQDKALKHAKQLQASLSKVSGIKANIKTYKLTSTSDK